VRENEGEAREERDERYRQRGEEKGRERGGKGIPDTTAVSVAPGLKDN
jgi:hypothetical protein